MAVEPVPTKENKKKSVNKRSLEFNQIHYLAKIRYHKIKWKGLIKHFNVLLFPSYHVIFYLIRASISIIHYL